MLSELSGILEEVYALRSLFDIVFRMVAGFLTSFGFSLVAGALFLKRAERFRAPVREDTPETHQAKNYTPTMGGIGILLSVIAASLIWCTLSAEVWIFLGCLGGFGLIGLWDDVFKLHYKKGIPESHKFGAQIIMGAIIVLAWYFIVAPPTAVSVPFFKGVAPKLGIYLIPWAVFILVGASNAVNLTDGLDGLATGSLIISCSTLALICLIAGNYAFTLHLHIPNTNTAEIAVIGGIVVGALMGFLWYNTYPAQLFMGDVGSLPLGAGLALMALMARQELLLPLIGGVFVVETLSVILQVVSFKLFGKRIFLMAPLHHHYELKGLHEAKITTRCVIITLILSIFALALLPFH